MPDRIPRPCRKAGCPRTTSDRSGYCNQHQKQKPARPPDNRPSPTRRGYSYQWTKARKLYLRNNPLCVQCEREGRVTAAQVVDHIQPHRGDAGLFWDSDNWQALCKPCHDRKTGRGM